MKLDRIQYAGLRIVLGAIKYTPVQNLLVESGELPLKLRRDELCLRYYIRAKSVGDTLPINAVVQKCTGWGFNGNRWKNDEIPFCYRVKQLEHEMKIDNIKIGENKVSTFAPWLIEKVKVSTKLTEHISKKDPNVLDKVTAQQYIDENYSEHLQIYTDGSKCPQTGKTASAFYIPAKNE